MTRDWIHLAGNHERQLLTLGSGERGASDEFTHSQLTAKEFAWIAGQRPRVRFSPEVVLCHGTPASDVEYFLETVEPTHVRAATLSEVDAHLGHLEAEVIACGHTHIPRSVRASTGQLVVNPGSVGLQAYDAMHPYPHVMATGSPDARYALVERLADMWVATLISVPYAYQTMVQLALTRQRQDWACALASGYI
jgi:diadenosine tetraphosphatase ApaH/serine/threonine PP2A family protein phosphatase